MDVKPMEAALAGALISGIAMYAVGARGQDNRLTAAPALVQTLDGQGVPLAQPAVSYYTTTARPAAMPVVQRTSAAPRTVYRAAQPAASRVVYQNADVKPHRSMTKTALIIGGSAASGAGVGGIVGGKKGAVLVAAIGGGAASIYEATRR